MNYPIVKEIVDIKKENDYVKSIYFENDKEIKPGQFFMIWIPDVDEIPMSVSYINKGLNAITFRKIGDATKALFKCKIGDRIGIRGPYGNGFRINGKNILFISGGTGLATLAPAIELANKRNIKCSIIIGFKNKEEIFFENRIKNISENIYFSTNDGSRGYHGNASDFSKDIFLKHKLDSVISCGPELMLKKLFDIFKDNKFQASLERYMKCAVGICGQCCIGEGLRVCLEGPIFDSIKLKDIRDFGKFKRNESGNIEYFLK
jgi:dihydroorotate dehydrogenase electron transfer subunit